MTPAVYTNDYIFTITSSIKHHPHVFATLEFWLCLQKCWMK